MCNFELLEQIYDSISSVEMALAEFVDYAIYELDGGIVVWCSTEKLIKDNLERQKAFLRHMRDESSELTEEQRGIMHGWHLD